MKFYVNSRYPNEKVSDEKTDMLDFIENNAGIKFKELPNTDTKKALQEDIKELLIEWFFSDWDEEDEDIPDLERDLEIADMIYQDDLERKWGLS